jgi:3-mercaptopyruvate sulfurtransferase SseA
VLEGGLAGRKLVQGIAAAVLAEVEGADVATLAPAELKSLIDREDVAIVDLGPSMAYEAGHIPGAWFAVRARLAR